MASLSWKSAAYVLVGIIVIILIILLNFDYLPKRRLSEHFGEKDSLATSNGPTHKASTSTGSVVEEDEFSQMTVSDYLKNIMVWNCSRKPTIDLYPELSVAEYENITWKCKDYPYLPDAFPENGSKSICYEYNDPFICVRDPLHCKHKDKSNSNKRFPVRPVYGEYKYLPKSIWLKAVLHGGVAFLYHPCTKYKVIDQLRRMARSCLRRHIITPYENLSPCQPIAMVAWGCFFSTSKINVSESKDWIRQRAMQAPASHVSDNGQFKEGLKEPAVTVSDRHETHLCPSGIQAIISQDEEEDEQNSSTREESLSKDRRPRRKFDTYNAVWALGSLLFLCLILGGVLVYTQPWQNRDHWWPIDNYNSNTRFSQMKGGRWGWKRRTFRSKKSPAYSQLLSAIPEEFEDDI